MSNTDRFHAHLDVCQRCREQVWNLCPVGEALLMKTTEDVLAVFDQFMDGAE